jgi:ribosomal protein L37AE/L43A
MAHPDRHPLDGNMIAADEHYADQDCEGCRGGDKWPASESVWRCPVCDAEYYDTDAPVDDVRLVE